MTISSERQLLCTGPRPGPGPSTGEASHAKVDAACPPGWRGGAHESVTVDEVGVARDRR